MVNEKLLKAFVLLQDVENSNKGDKFFLKRRQATIPLINENIFFENMRNGHKLSLRWFIENKWSKAKPSEFFLNIEQKFEHIT